MNYSQAVKKSLPAFIMARLTPTIGISIVFLLMAHKSAEDLPVFSYVLAAASVISAFCSIILAMIGNRAASLAHSPSAQRDLFTGGFTLALFIAALTSLACLSATYFILRTNGLQHLDREVFWTLSLIYIASTPLLVINNFLQLFLEATGKASSCANAKIVITTLCCTSLAVLFAIISSDEFKYYAMSYFLSAEFLTLLLLTKLTNGERYCSFILAKKTSCYFLRTGIPIAAGLSGQKIYFYLLTERLARIDAQLVAQLSIFMTVIGILIIPSLAISQIHSLQVSRQVKQSAQCYRAGLTWVISIMVLSGVILYFCGEYAFLAIGGSVTDYSMKLYYTLVICLTSSSLLSLAFAHLRARSEIFIPQLLINTIMLAVLTPALYNLNLNTPDMETFLLLQSAATFAGFLLLCARIFFVHRSDEKSASVLLARGHGQR
ncbi:hypothetical protein [Pseudomonas fluorescens]|uniref:Polysaccharide biosynthesis protein n=1 Tax=Pseudomonas fluorescens TaxID=294 RepID=A0A5E7DWZ2_PSEFL|nr:hypothetical protein [Pseudomonas fluorescens]VVO16745.1 hypothetical protein PS691_03858 [Pseudomonas fluorescens]